MPLATTTFVLAGGWVLFSRGPGVVACTTCDGYPIGFGFYVHDTLRTNATRMTPHKHGAAVTIFSSAIFIESTGGTRITHDEPVRHQFHCSSPAQRLAPILAL